MKKEGVKKKKQEAVNMTNIAKQLLELGILVSTPREEEKEVKVIYDKSQDQFSIKIPRGMARTMGIDNKKDTFKFKFGRDRDDKPFLQGELIKK